MKQLNFEVFVLKFMLWLLFMAILCCKIPFSNGKSNFKMGFYLLNNKSRKQFVYSIFSDKMRFCEFCRFQLGLKKSNVNPVSVSHLCESETCGKASIQER